MTETDHKAEEEKKNSEQKEKVKDKIITTKHSVTINGKKIDYTAITGTMVIHEEDDEKGPLQKASMFFTAYFKKDETPEERPITFSFNGGPGSSSVWMHLGLLGPRIVNAEKDAKPVPPPYKLENNNYSILDSTDLVFIDPVSTGYSRTVEGEKPDVFHGYEKDIESVAEFIRLFTTRYERWSSPKFLIGESYGTTRASGLSGYLQDKFGMYLNGIMLISSILNFQTAIFTPGNDLPYLLFLPTYAAIAWYHKKLDGELQKDLMKTLDEVKSFVMTDYTLALMKGDTISDEERNSIVERVSKYTGLSKTYVDYANMRINIHKFTKELLREQKRTVGRLDGRYIGIDRDPTDAMSDHDPSYTAIMGPYTATLYDYVRRDLKFESDLVYEIIKPLYQKWDYKKFQNKFVNVADILRESISKNNNLKVFVANGYYDLATPFFATDYTFNHMGLDPSLRDNISMGFYEAGHMMYLHQPSLKKLKEDLTKFIENSK